MPVPVWGEHVPKVLWENHVYSKPLPTQTKAEYLDATNALRESINRLKLRNLSIYEVYGYLCDDECAMTNSDADPLYFDDNHLTLTGSAKLSELFKIVLNNCSQEECVSGAWEPFAGRHGERSEGG